MKVQLGLVRTECELMKQTEAIEASISIMKQESRVVVAETEADILKPSLLAKDYDPRPFSRPLAD